MYTILLDCYTDEAAGLGVPPYLGTYPRYLFGQLKLQGKQVRYVTVDDVRAYIRELTLHKQKRLPQTDIMVYNRVCRDVGDALMRADEMIVNVGVHVPGKYLSAMPGTFHELQRLIPLLHFTKPIIITGPAVFGTQLHGGKEQESPITTFAHEIKPFYFTYSGIAQAAIEGSKILNQVTDLRVLEIETGRGCQTKPGCSFCTEPLKSKLEFRETKDILTEVSALYEQGARYFRLGKQACYYAHKDATIIVKEIRRLCSDIKVLHIDNVNPVNVITQRGIEITKAIAQYCTEGNIAPFGVESFDPEVGKRNNLNTNPQIAYDAIKIINQFGKENGENGMPKYLPGINILFGLDGESKKTHEENMKWLTKIKDGGLLLRRINIRQVAVMQGTDLATNAGTKFLHKNKKFYWKWRNDIRQNIDQAMLNAFLPKGSIIKNVRMEIHDGNTTFGRQIGTYPLAIGIKQKLELGSWYTVKVKKAMLRSIEAEIVQKEQKTNTSPVTAV